MWKLLVGPDARAARRPRSTSPTSPTSLTPEEALEHAARKRRPAERRARPRCARDGYPAYTTSTGWLGYPDEKVRRLCREAIAEGWTAFKMKVGRNLEDNMRRAALMREEIGPERKLMMDANQCWDVGEAIRQMKALARFDPWWIEEPTSPDDVLGHAAIARAIAPIGVATGEVCQNRVIFKQLLQADAIRFLQVDSCRMGGVNEVAGRAADGREVRGAGVPARRRRRPLRVRAAPLDLRLHRGQRLPRGPASASTSTTCTSTSSIPCVIRERALRRPAAARLQHHTSSRSRSTSTSSRRTGLARWRSSLR